MKPANCFSVEYILGVHNDKRKENAVDKRKLSTEEDDVRMKVDVKIEEKQEKSHSDDDQVIITSEKGIAINFFVLIVFLS